jgi:SAM-dependent methyltransferase
LQTAEMREWLPRWGLSGKVLEVGSLNVNGTIRAWVPVTVGIDLRQGKGVDKVMDACDLPKEYPAHYFDHVVSVDALEHARNWKGFVQGMWQVLKPGGLCVLAACAPGKGHHDHNGDYWRFTAEDFRRVYAAQEILDVRKLGASVGIVCRKQVEEIDTGFEVKAAPPKRGR